MEVTCQITPEMLGFSWWHVLWKGLTATVIALLSGLVVSKFLHGHFLTGGLVGLAGSTVACALLVSPLSRTKLRVTDDCIEQLDGSVIRKDGIARVNEYTDSKCPGIEIIGIGRPQWLRKYSIFVPAALAEYPQVRQLVYGWATPEHWHTV